MPDSIDSSGYESPAAVDETALQATPPPSNLTHPRVWTVFVATVVALVLSIATQAVVAAILAGSMLASGVPPQELEETLVPELMSPPWFIAMLVLSQFSILASATIAAALSPVPLFDRLGLVAPRCPKWAHAVFVVGSALPLALGVGSAYLVSKLIEPDESVQSLYEQMNSTWAIPFIVLIGLLPGVCEEVLFRGYMQRRLIDRWGPVAGILATSIVFGLFHVTPHGIALATILGLWLGILAYRTGSIWSGIFCHALINSGWNIWQVGKQLWGFPETPTLTFSVLGITFMLGTFAVAVWVVLIQTETASPAEN